MSMARRAARAAKMPAVTRSRRRRTVLPARKKRSVRLPASRPAVASTGKPTEMKTAPRTRNWTVAGQLPAPVVMNCGTNAR
jgi:hypothetical protein